MGGKSRSLSTLFLLAAGILWCASSAEGGNVALWSLTSPDYRAPTTDTNDPRAWAIWPREVADHLTYHLEITASPEMKPKLVRVVEAAMKVWEDAANITFARSVSKDQANIIILIQHENPSGPVTHGGGNGALIRRDAQGRLQQSVLALRYHGEQKEAANPRDDPWVWLAVHELGHGVGLWHDFQRADRDRYMRIDPDPGFLPRLAEERGATAGTDFDAASVMMYAWTDDDRWEKRYYLVTPDLGEPLPTVNYYQRNGLSAGDIAVIREMYGPPRNSLLPPPQHEPPVRSDAPLDRLRDQGWQKVAPPGTSIYGIRSPSAEMESDTVVFETEKGLWDHWTMGGDPPRFKRPIRTDAFTFSIAMDADYVPPGSSPGLFVILGPRDWITFGPREHPRALAIQRTGSDPSSSVMMPRSRFRLIARYRDRRIEFWSECEGRRYEIASLPLAEVPTELAFGDRNWGAAEFAYRRVKYSNVRLIVDDRDGGGETLKPGRDFTKPWHVESRETRRIEAVLSVRQSFPRLKADEWLIVSPAPPEHPTQTRPRLRMYLPRKPLTAIPGAELSSLSRPILSLRTLPKDPDLETGFDCRLIFDAQLKARRLVPGPSPEPVAPLDDSQRSLYLRSSTEVDWSTDTFRKWLIEATLIREPGEKDIVFASRVFQALLPMLKYVTSPDDRRASVVCQRKASDCGGIAATYVAALRANGIPARTLYGRWASSEEGDYKQWHVKSEFFAEGIGWVPVEQTVPINYPTVDKDDFFGRDDGNFLTFHIDQDLRINTINFGIPTIPGMQGPCYWAPGSGSWEGGTATEHWNVIDLAPESAVLTGIEIRGGAASIFETGSAAFQCRAICEDGSKTEITSSPEIRWWVSDPGAAGVSATGLVSARPVTEDRRVSIRAGYQGFIDDESLVIRDIRVVPGELRVTAISGELHAVQKSGLPAPQTFAVRNAGGSAFAFAVKNRLPSLKASPSSGTVTPGGEQIITVSATTTDLPVNTYLDQFTVEAPTALASPALVTSTYRISKPAPRPGELTVSAISGALRAVQKGALPAPQTFTIGNTGGSAIHFSTQHLLPGLLIEPSSGDVEPGLECIVTVRAITTDLAADTYLDQITVEALGAASSPAIVDVLYGITKPVAAEWTTGKLDADRWYLVHPPRGLKKPTTRIFADALGGFAVAGEKWKLHAAGSEGIGAAIKAERVLAETEAFWIMTTESNREVKAEIGGAPPDPSRLRLLPGWNAVVNTCSASVFWKRIRVETREKGMLAAGAAEVGDYLHAAVYVWNPRAGKAGEYARCDTSEIRAGESFWVHAYRSCTLVMDPGAGRAAQALSAAGWTVNLTAVLTGTAERSGVTIGTADGAVRGFDLQDMLAPPPPPTLAPSEVSRLSLPHADWGARSGSFTQDLRGLSAAASGESWTIELRAPGWRGGRVALLWTGKHPDTGQLLLLDRTRDKTVSISGNGSYDFVPSGDREEFEVRWIAAQGNAPANAAAALDPHAPVFVYPNPATEGQVWFRVVSPSPLTTASVDLITIAGRRARELQFSNPTPTVAPGPQFVYDLPFDCRNGVGQTLASGVYLFVCRAAMQSGESVKYPPGKLMILRPRTRDASSASADEDDASIDARESIPMNPREAAAADDLYEFLLCLNSSTDSTNILARLIPKKFAALRKKHAGTHAAAEASLALAGWSFCAGSPDEASALLRQAEKSRFVDIRARARLLQELFSASPK